MDMPKKRKEEYIEGAVITVIPDTRWVDHTPEQFERWKRRAGKIFSNFLDKEISLA